MTLIARFHLLLARIGVKPALADGLIAAVLGIAAHAIITGAFNLGEIKMLGVTALYAVVAGIAPPAAGVHQDEVDQKALARSAQLPRRPRR